MMDELKFNEEQIQCYLQYIHTEKYKQEHRVAAACHLKNLVKKVFGVSALEWLMGVRTTTTRVTRRRRGSKLREMRS